MYNEQKVLTVSSYDNELVNAMIIILNIKPHNLCKYKSNSDDPIVS